MLNLRGKRHIHGDLEKGIYMALKRDLGRSYKVTLLTGIWMETKNHGFGREYLKKVEKRRAEAWDHDLRISIS